MQSPKVSVIVPVYNVARYLPQCLDSLVAQTLQEVEFILINDGSTDGSASILRAYVEKDPRFRLIEQMNKGYSGARNTGLKEVRGEYVGFIDADDWADPTMFEHLLQLARQHDADIAQCGFSLFFERKKTSVKWDHSWIPPLLKRSGGLLRGAEEILFEGVGIWKKIYRRSLLEANELIFDEGMAMGEDVPFHLSALCLANRIAASDLPLYHYRKQRPGQQTAIRDRRLLAYFRIFEKMDELLQRHELAYLQPWLLHLQLSRHCWGYGLASPEVHQEYFQRLHETFRNAGITAQSPIAPGCWTYGSMATRLRWLSLRIIHPAALRAILNRDQKHFDRIIRFREVIQHPVSEMKGLFSGIARKAKI